MSLFLDLMCLAANRSQSSAYSADSVLLSGHSFYSAGWLAHPFFLGPERIPPTHRGGRPTYRAFVLSGWLLGGHGTYGPAPATRGWLAHTALPNRHRPFGRAFYVFLRNLLVADVCTTCSCFMCSCGSWSLPSCVSR